MEGSLQPGLELKAPTLSRIQSLLEIGELTRLGEEAHPPHHSIMQRFQEVHSTAVLQMAWQRDFPGRCRSLCPSYGQGILSPGPRVFLMGLPGSWSVGGEMMSGLVL